MRPITLDGFEQTFQGSNDPWATFTARDEAVKRDAILRALGARPRGRVLELGAGNGSNSVALARRARALDATEGTAKGTALTRTALADAGAPHARACQLALPGPFPRATYDAIVIAELLYYLSARDMAAVARDTARALRPGGRLVLAHHRVDFHDFAQHACGIHERFLAEAGCGWRRRTIVRNGRWIVAGYDRGGAGGIRSL